MTWAPGVRFLPPQETSSPFDGPTFRNPQEARPVIGRYVFWRCEACGRRPRVRSALHLHRVIPKSRAPIHTWGNLVLVCADCHYGEAHRLPPAVCHRSVFIEAMQNIRAMTRPEWNAWTLAVSRSTDFTTLNRRIQGYPA